MDELGDLKELLLHYARGVWKNRWISIAIASLALLVGVAVVDQIKNRYKAETKVYIDSTTVLKPLLRGLAIDSDFEGIVRLMVRQLLSRPNLERAARIMDMDLEVQSSAGMEKLIERIRDRVEVSANRKTGVYTISYTDTNRRRARQMVQTLLDIFVEDTLGKSVTESDSAIEFLDQQIEKYDRLLREAEDRLESFKRANIGMMPQDGESYYEQLRQIEGQIEQSELTLSELANRRGMIGGQIEKMRAEESQQKTVVKSSLDLRIEEQERRIDEMLILYTEEHPDVLNARHVLQTLRDRKQGDVEQVVTTRSSLENPVFQQLQILLSKTEADISSIEARIQSLRRKRTELSKLVDVVPQIEAELQRLNRGYEVHRKNYSELVARREKARISDDVESGTEHVKFRIIEPPFVPLEPDYPNRLNFGLGVLFIALAVGYGIGLLISMLQPVFYNQVDLRYTIGRAVLGAVNKFDTPNVVAKRRKDLVLFSGANLLFFGVAAALLYVHSQGVLILSWLHAQVT